MRLNQAEFSLVKNSARAVERQSFRSATPKLAPLIPRRRMDYLWHKRIGSVSNVPQNTVDPECPFWDPFSIRANRRVGAAGSLGPETVRVAKRLRQTDS